MMEQIKNPIIVILIVLALSYLFVPRIIGMAQDVRSGVKQFSDKGELEYGEMSADMDYEIRFDVTKEQAEAAIKNFAEKILEAKGDFEGTEHEAEVERYKWTMGDDGTMDANALYRYAEARDHIREAGYAAGFVHLSDDAGLISSSKEKFVKEIELARKQIDGLIQSNDQNEFSPKLLAYAYATKGMIEIESRFDTSPFYASGPIDWKEANRQFVAANKILRDNEISSSRISALESQSAKCSSIKSCSNYRDDKEACLNNLRISSLNNCYIGPNSCKWDHKKGSCVSCSKKPRDPKATCNSEYKDLYSCADDSCWVTDSENHCFWNTTGTDFCHKKKGSGEGYTALTSSVFENAWNSFWYG